MRPGIPTERLNQYRKNARITEDGRCAAVNTDGQMCSQRPLRGEEYCGRHAGKYPEVVSEDLRLALSALSARLDRVMDELRDGSMDPSVGRSVAAVAKVQLESLMVAQRSVAKPVDISDDELQQMSPDQIDELLRQASS